MISLRRDPYIAFLSIMPVFGSVLISFSSFAMLVMNISLF